MNQPPHCWQILLFEGCIVLRWITSHLSPLAVSLMLPLKVKVSPDVTYLNVVKTLTCRVHCLIWSALLTL